MSGILLRLVYYLVIAFFIGTIAQFITGYRRHRIFTTFIIGFIGVVAGDFIANHYQFWHIIPRVFGISLVWSILGAVAFILLFRLIRGRW